MVKRLTIPLLALALCVSARFEKVVNYMKMKPFVAALAVVASLLSFCSCEKEGVKLFDGNYSFKTSGILTIERTAKVSESDASAEIPARISDSGNRTFKLPLTSESGQMNIIKTGDNSVIVTMNIVGGDALVFNGKAEGKVLTLDPAVRFLSFRDGANTVSLEITVSGTAEKHDDVAIFTLEYTGGGETTLYDYKILASEVKCVAKLNED